MYRKILLIFAAIAFSLIVLFVIYFFRPTPSPSTKASAIRSQATETSENHGMTRSEYDYIRMRHPITKTIPKNIKTLELNFIKQSMATTAGQQPVVSTEWQARGPYNIGGRTKALAIDVKNEDTILAGCVSSGMWRSADGGNSWRKTTAPDQLHSVSCIAQNKKPGKEHIWYYGTGEYGGSRGGSAAGPLGTYSFYRGDGIFKSTDHGETWSLLPSTVSGTPNATDDFDFIYKILTFGDDGVLAATSTGVFISHDGGTSWKHVLNFGEKYPSSDIAITSRGTFYAAIDGKGNANGLYQSTDGENWQDISPPAFPDTTVRSVIAVPPANEKSIYLLSDVAHWKQKFYKYEEGSGWVDLTGGLPCNAEMTTYGGNMLMLYVKPDDPNTLFLGTVGLYRSMNGGRSFEEIGSFSDFHVDQHSIAFFPSDPKAMIVGNDGGLFKTNDNTAVPKPDPINGDYHIEWQSLNNGYVTSQFYTVAIDQATPGSEMILGGTQDNSWLFTDSTDPLKPWTGIFPGATDGGFCAIGEGGRYFYTGQAATFTFWRHEFIDGVHHWTEITPASAIGMGLWMNPMLLDVHDTKIMYLPSQRQLWRNSDLTTIPEVFPPTPTNVNWERLQNVNPAWHISALGMSEALPRRLYYGCVAGGMARLDNPHEGQPIPVMLQGNNIQYYEHRYVHCIAVDPRHVDRLLVGYPDYGVISIYYSEDAGDHWTPVAGNLEEHPDGSGNGPSVRWLAILYVEDKPLYFAGTSVGLFSTTQLNGMNTVWVQEGANTIGNVVIDMIAVRQADGFVAVATHGNGIYSTRITQFPSRVEDNVTLPTSCALYPAFPNPFNSNTNIRFTLPHAGSVRLTVHNILGEQVVTLVDRHMPAGEHRMVWQAGTVASGTYFIHLNFENNSRSQKVLLQR